MKSKGIEQNIYAMSVERPKNVVLTRVINQYIEETITDEQVCRVLAPVINMISGDVFRIAAHRRTIQRLLRNAMKILVLVYAIVVVLTICILLSATQQAAGPDDIRNNFVGETTISAGESVTMMGPENRLSGVIDISKEDIDGIVVELFDIDMQTTVEFVQLGKDGSYCFEGFSDGRYKLNIVLHDAAETIAEDLRIQQHGVYIFS